MSIETSQGHHNADMAKLVDAPDLGSGENIVRVRVPLSAPVNSLN